MEGNNDITVTCPSLSAPSGPDIENNDLKYILHCRQETLNPK